MRLLAALTLFLGCPSMTFAALPAPGSTYHLLFATNEVLTITNNATYPPPLGFFNSLAGADWQATFAAANAGLPGTETWDGSSILYKAILSTSTTSAFSRVTVNGSVYNTHGIRLATSKTDLFNGSIEHPVDYNEYGQYILEDPDVWTGSTPSGGWAGSSCVGWNSPASSGQLGDAFVSDATWLTAGATINRPASTVLARPSRLRCGATSRATTSSMRPTT